MRRVMPDRRLSALVSRFLAGPDKLALQEPRAADRTGFAEPLRKCADQPFGGTCSWAKVFAPQVTVTVVIAALLGIVAATSHVSAGAP